MPALVTGGPGNLTPDELLLRQQAAALQTGSPFPFPTSGGPPTAAQSQAMPSQGSTQAGTWYGLGAFRWPRQIGTLVAHITITEEARDDLSITEHPVESNAPVSDHAYLNPPRVIIRCAWSNNRPEAGQNRMSFARDVYKQLLGLQASRIPFTLLTGKRNYKNMLIQSLNNTTDADTEDSLMMTIVAQQVIIVDVQVISVPQTANSQIPQELAAPENRGVQQPKPIGKLPPSLEQQQSGVGT